MKTKSRRVLDLKKRDPKINLLTDKGVPSLTFYAYDRPAGKYKFLPIPVKGCFCTRIVRVWSLSKRLEGKTHR